MKPNNNKIANFEEFGKMFEMTEFNLQRMNPDSGGMMPNVADPQLSINAFDKHEDAIRAATSKLSGLLNALSNTPQFTMLKSRLTLEDQNITAMKILRISKTDIRYDVYISFVIKEEEFWGVVEDITGNAEFISEVFKDADLTLTKEWIIKIKGLVIKILKKWLTPEDGKYKLLNDEAFCYNVNTGRIEKLTKGDEIEVVRSYDNKIVIMFDNDYFNLVNDNFIYFNYWFVKSN